MQYLTIVVDGGRGEDEGGEVVENRRRGGRVGRLSSSSSSMSMS